MQPNEPSGYENEPKEIFFTLPAETYCTLYHLEMAGFEEDSIFYHELLMENYCQSVIELGCGTGRISEYLQKQSMALTGIDISRSMLAFSRQTRTVPTVQMDMCRLGFSSCFHAAVIPYNTLNLLPNRQLIQNCLAEVKQVLTGPRLLLMQLFSPDAGLIKRAYERIFQFRLFDWPGGGRLVKETIKTYIPETQCIHLEERYKIRPSGTTGINRNYTHKLYMSALTAKDWIDLIVLSGYRIVSLYGSYKRHPYNPDKSSTLLVLAQSN